MIIPINQYLVPLTQGKFAIVDAEGWEKVKHYKWFFARGYAVRTIVDDKGSNYQLRMHRFLMDALKGTEVDHINGDKSDNRYCNLRLCTRSENVINTSKRKGCSSFFKGVSFNKRNKKWQAYITVKNNTVHIGYFYNEIDAAKAYNNYALEYHGEFARLNIIDG